MAETNFNNRDPIDALASDDKIVVWDESAGKVVNMTGAQLAAEFGGGGAGGLTTETITEADSPHTAAGGLIIVSAAAAAPITISFPASAAAGAGWTQRIWNRSDQALTLAQAGGDSWEMESGDLSSLTLVSAGLAGERVEIVADGSATLGIWTAAATLTPT